MVWKRKNRTEHGRFEPVFSSIQKLEKQYFWFDYLFWPIIGPNWKCSPLLLIFLIIIIYMVLLNPLNRYPIPNPLQHMNERKNLEYDPNLNGFIIILTYISFFLCATCLPPETTLSFQIARVKKIIYVNLERWLNSP